MKLVTRAGTVRCDHDGVVATNARQSMVTVGGVPVLVADDPVGCRIDGCPNSGPSIKPCLLTLRVQHGYSSFVSVDGRPVCLEDVHGFTDGTPPGVVRYTVRDPGQSVVEVGS